MEYQTPIGTEVGPKSVGIAPGDNVAKKSKGLFIGLVACIIIAICGVAFGIYGVVTSNSKSSEISDLKSQIVAINSTLAALESNQPNIPQEDHNSQDPAPSTNPYTTFANNLAQNYSGTVFGYYYHYTGTDNVRRTVAAQVDKNSHLQIVDLDDGNKTIAEANDIISVYYIQVGNGGVPYFYLIKKDGQVARINLLEIETDKSIENISGYKNIVSVIEGADLYAWLIDIEGNLYRTV